MNPRPSDSLDKTAKRAAEAYPQWVMCRNLPGFPAYPLASRVG